MIHITQTHRALVWAATAAIAALVALLCLAAFRGYLSSEMLLNFANMLYC